MQSYNPQSYGFDQNIGQSSQIKPWTRFWARLLDCLIFETIIFYAANATANKELDFSTALLLYLVTLLLWVFIEAVILSVLGTTPGKWLFGIVVKDEYGKRPRFFRALKRGWLVWVYGITMGMPLFCIIGLINSHSRLKVRKTTSWDTGSGCNVRYKNSQPIKQIIAATLIFIIVNTQLINPIKDQSAWLENPLDFFGNFNRDPLREASLAYILNDQGSSLLEEGEYSQAKEKLLQALELDPDNELRATIFQNLSYACYHMSEFELSLEYITESMSISPMDADKYTQYGNTLAATDSTSEAEDAYRKAIELDHGSYNAYYGLGLVLYEKKLYEEAIENFENYTHMVEDDPDGWCYLGLSCLYGENDAAKAKGFLDKAMSLDPSNTDTIKSMAEYYDYTGASEKAKEIYRNAISENQGDYDLLCGAAEFHYYNGSYDEALRYADKAISLNAGEIEAYRIKAQAYLWNQEKQKAVETIDTMLEINQNDPDIYTIAGDIYYNAYEYQLAYHYYEEALQKDPVDKYASIGKIGTLYYRKRYTACLDFALEVEKKFDDDINIPWYIGDTYSALHDSESAISYYEKTLGMDPDNTNIMLSLGWEHYYNGDYTQAKEYADEVLESDSSNYYAKDLKEAAQDRQRNIAEQIADFIETNYMYFKPSNDYDKVRQELTNKGNVTDEELLELFGNAYEAGDMFSFIFYGEYYRQYMEFSRDNTVESEMLDESIINVKISSFTESTANDFLDIIDNVQDPGNKYLVIDLRNNGGGDTNSGCNILDFLLPDCVVCNLIYKDGYSNSYYSDDEYISFKHIFILTDENTASCSELVALGLKTYLDNVTVIGKKTFGKGIGQLGYEDKTREVAVFVVNHFWNVRETNIMDKGIEPDIVVAGNSDEEHFTEIHKLISSLYKMG